jgi:hypothetical protein
VVEITDHGCHVRPVDSRHRGPVDVVVHEIAALISLQPRAPSKDGAIGVDSQEVVSEQLAQLSDVTSPFRSGPTFDECKDVSRARSHAIVVRPDLGPANPCNP